MKKSTKVTLGAAAVGGAALGAYLSTKSEEQIKTACLDSVDKAAKSLFSGLSRLVRSPEPADAQGYQNEFFMPGHDEIKSSVSRSNAWSLGFAQEDITPDDCELTDYYLGGFLSIPPNVVTGIIDAMFVRTMILDDASGRGAVLFAVVDCIGFTSGNVLEVRKRLSRFAKENNIVSINVSATHCHSAVDTMGIWGPLTEKLGSNISAVNDGRPEDVVSGRNEVFMEKIRTAICSCAREAFADMKRGKLYSSVIDGREYIRNKRDRGVAMTDITRLRFAPDDGSRETVAVFMGAHPTCMGMKNTRISGDYPHYFVEAIEAAGANGIFFQGAELAIATDRHLVEVEDGDEREFASIIAYGHAIAELALSRKNEKSVAPLLNARHAQLFVPVDNSILYMVERLHLSNNILLKNGTKKGDYVLCTEIGVIALGRSLKIALVPGEIAPELIIGGTVPTELSYKKEPWGFEPVKDMFPEGSHTAVIGLCNDAVGYIVPDNDFGSIIAPGHYEEAVSVGSRAASSIIRSMSVLTKEFN